MRNVTLNGGRGVLLIATTYVFFLIFAQFAFLTRLNQLGFTEDWLRIILGAMAIGGAGTSMILPRSSTIANWPFELRVGLIGCSLCALVTLMHLTVQTAVSISLLMGTSLGTLTVAQAALLPSLLGEQHRLLKVGLGTGIGYAICNIPALFTASPQAQAVTAAALCFITLIAIWRVPASDSSQPSAQRTTPIASAVVVFTALIWLDSAAFYIIQQTPQLKAGTWQGSLHLWTNAVLHFAVAVVAGLWLSKRGLRPVASVAFIALAIACVLLHNTARIPLASLFYPAGVSLYSTALVAFPALLSGAQTPQDRARHAGWIYAIGGWFGSAMGIGMAQHLGQVPYLFLAIAGTAIVLVLGLGVLRRHLRETATVALVTGGGALFAHLLPAKAPPVNDPIARGREVYIHEGCIHCHSQYVRPGTSDVARYGPVVPLAEIRAEQPPLIGNRRQGPDLSNVGARHDLPWLRAHQMHPASVSPRSFMPDYAYLFADSRGDDLIAYLHSLNHTPKDTP